jgi:uncharacterized protein (DUF1810 family)
MKTAQQARPCNPSTQRLDLAIFMATKITIGGHDLEVTVTEADLIHFVNAQSDVYDQVTDELTKGRKRTHWMWFIFPQLEGLGYSSMAQRYAIRDLDQARRYLADPLLGSRLRHDVRLVMSHEGKSALDILGSPDDLKLDPVSPCLLKRLRRSPTLRCSSKLSINFIAASWILERWSY